MALYEEFEKQGNWLFRWRSYLPVSALILFAVASIESRYPLLDVIYRQSWEIVCLTVSFTGLGIRIITAGFVPTRTSGRNTKSQVADTLNTKGIYSVVRHPLYLGNYLITFGISLLLMVWWLPVIISLLYWVYYERIMFAEEAFLRGKFGDEYIAWSGNTPAFIPSFSKWEFPELKISFKIIIKREYTGFFGIIALFTFLHFGSEILATSKVSVDPVWIVFFGIGLVLYVLAILLKKKTRILHVHGR